MSTLREDPRGAGAIRVAAGRESGIVTVMEDAPSIARLTPFALEDFFDTYEHQLGLINLASSDCLPWTLPEMIERVPKLKGTVDELTFTYPDPRPVAAAIAERWKWPPDVEIIPAAGAAEALSIVLHFIALCVKRDGRIAIPAPGYGAVAGIAEALGLRVTSYSYRPENHWGPDEGEVVSLARQCDAFVITNPHNPTGHVLGNDVVDRVAREMAQRNGLLLIDEVFRSPEHMQWLPSERARCVTIGSLSKTSGLPGLRLGWIGCPANMRGRLRTIQQYLTLSLSSLAVKLGIAVVRAGDAFSRTPLLEKNREILTSWASRHPDAVRLSQPMGGTTVCLEVIGRPDEDALFHEMIARKVLLVPGRQCFGVGDRTWFRLGYGAASLRLAEGLERIAAALHLRS